MIRGILATMLVVSGITTIVTANSPPCRVQEELKTVVDGQASIISSLADTLKKSITSLEKSCNK